MRVSPSDYTLVAMSYQWLKMRISEEKDRRERENNILNRLPAAVDELQRELELCIVDYNEAFGAGRASVEAAASVITVQAADAKVEISMDPLLPGFQVDQPAGRLSIVVGILPTGNLFYRDEEKYLTLEEMTKRILDRTLFPKLKE